MDVSIEKDVAVPMRDGTILRADVYRPQAAGKYPVLMQRTPYNKELWPVTALTLDPVRAAAAGYVVVIQDVRARWGSDGDTFFPYRNELDDGYDTATWASGQSWSSGAVGAYGLSYMGGTSWLAAASGHESIRAISPTTAPNHFWHNHFWRNGALHLGTLAMWALRAIGPSALFRSKRPPHELGPLLLRLIEDIDGFEETVSNLPLCELAAGRPDDPEFVPFLFDLLNHPEPDSWTDGILLNEERHRRVACPALIIAGWHDLLLAADLEHWKAMREAGGVAANGTRMIVGPWSHGMFQNVVGDVEMGFRANGLFLDLKEDLTRLQLRYFDRWLRDEPDAFQDPPVRVFVQGANVWRDEEDWPLARAVETAWYLQPDGGLSESSPSTGPRSQSYVSDPNDPVPTRGGHILLPQQYVPGPVDQRDLLNRRDVLAFTSEILTGPLEVTGPVKAVLYAATSAPDTDWVVKLCDVAADGRTVNVCDGVLRASYREGATRTLVEPGTIIRYEVDLWSTSMQFGAGHRLRVLIASSDFPRYDRNPNSGELAQTAQQLEPALQTIFHSPDSASHVLLPVVRSSV